LLRNQGTRQSAKPGKKFDVLKAQPPPFSNGFIERVNDSKRERKEWNSSVENVEMLAKFKWRISKEGIWLDVLIEWVEMIALKLAAIKASQVEDFSPAKGNLLGSLKFVAEFLGPALSEFIIVGKANGEMVQV
jgi:hypothetical protein